MRRVRLLICFGAVCVLLFSMLSMSSAEGRPPPDLLPPRPKPIGVTVAAAAAEAAERARLRRDAMEFAAAAVELADELERQREARAAARRAEQPTVPTVPTVPTGSVWDRLAACESNGNWQINTGNGYYGGLQFNIGTWRAYGGSGFPHQHSKAEQIRVAENLRAARGFQPWPACSRNLGLR